MPWSASYYTSHNPYPTSASPAHIGNICRSPLGEAVMRHVAKERGLSDMVVDSAGTAGYHVGEEPDERSLISSSTARTYQLIASRMYSFQNSPNVQKGPSTQSRTPYTIKAANKQENTQHDLLPSLP